MLEREFVARECVSECACVARGCVCGDPSDAPKALFVLVELVRMTSILHAKTRIYTGFRHQTSRPAVYGRPRPHFASGRFDQARDFLSVS